MKSIRVFLIVALVAIITLANFIASLNGYDKSMIEANKIFDQHLSRYANLLRVIPWKTIDNQQIRNSEQRIKEFMQSHKEQVIAYKIWDSKSLHSISSNMDELKTVETLPLGLHMINFSGYRWNTLIIEDASQQLKILVAERNDLRFTLSEKIVLASIASIIIVIPFIALFIWLVVGFGLSPITQFADNFKSKEASDLSPIKLDDEPKELTVLIHSANDLLKRLEQSFEREKRFSSDAAHELRTPITALKLHIDNLLAQSLEPCDSTELLKLSIDRMGHLVEQILILNRTAHDKYLMNFSHFDLSEMAQNCIAQTYGKLASKNISIELISTKCTINADKFGIETIINNLLSNAIKYCPRESAIEVSLTSADDYITLVVMDSGPGIKESLHERVFERFYRVDGDCHSSDNNGCGLGLSIVSRIVELHNATISLSSSSQHSKFISGLRVSIKFPKLVS